MRPAPSPAVALDAARLRVALAAIGLNIVAVGLLTLAPYHAACFLADRLS